MVLVIQLPFSAQAFFDVFGRYNSDLPYAGNLLAGIAIVSAVLSITSWRRASIVLLAGLWLWAGIVYHLVYFSNVNPMAYGFGVLFILQSGFFLIAAVRPPRSEENYCSSNLYVGVGLIVFSLLVYPLLGYVAGHSFPRNPTFGLPCPLTICTLGILLLQPRQVPNWVKIIPLLWAAIGTTAALFFGVWEDLSLLASGVIFVFIHVSIWTRTTQNRTKHEN